jgi:hypothetical protein
MNPGNLAVRPQKTPEMRMRNAGGQRKGKPGNARQGYFMKNAYIYENLSRTNP